MYPSQNGFLESKDFVLEFFKFSGNVRVFLGHLLSLLPVSAQEQLAPTLNPVGTYLHGSNESRWTNFPACPAHKLALRECARRGLKHTEDLEWAESDRFASRW